MMWKSIPARTMASLTWSIETQAARHQTDPGHMMLFVIFETKTGLTVLSGCQDELGCLEEGRRPDPLDRQKQCVQHVCVISSHDITAVRIHNSRTARTRTWSICIPQLERMLCILRCDPSTAGILLLTLRPCFMDYSPFWYGYANRRSVNEQQVELPN